MRINDDYENPAGVHGVQKLEGVIALEKSQVIEDGEISPGDYIKWFDLPDGKFLITKDPAGVRIEKISSAYYHLEADVVVEEQ
jgi:hypothetical protein